MITEDWKRQYTAKLQADLPGAVRADGPPADAEGGIKMLFTFITQLVNQIGTLVTGLGLLVVGLL